ncbi:hypothetical protein [Adhaeribacter aquaticus]|uniref:hypothetical protein n=1 Tax=Adhaeribacter aquaticus TaxID=299567 RepID=UPI0004159FB6|nr:hypothetical protein [Adhaeribacter aquaticus]
MIKLSAKQKREFSSVTNLVLHVLIFIALLVTLNSCTKEVKDTNALASPIKEDSRGKGYLVKATKNSYFSCSFLQPLEVKNKI